MSDDPKRLLDLAREGEAPAQLGDALEVAREQLPSEEQLDRLAAALGPLLGGGGGGSPLDSGGDPGPTSGGPPIDASGGAAGAGASGATGVGAAGAGGGAAGAGTVTAGWLGSKGIAIIVTATVVAAGTVWIATPSGEPVARLPVEPPTTTAPSPETEADVSAGAAAPIQETPAPVVAPEPEEAVAEPHRQVRATTPRLEPPRPSAQTPNSPSETPAAEEPAESDPAAEAQLLGRAQDALQSDPGQALLLLVEHSARFPGGILAQEREILRADALIRLGRRAEAETTLERFRTRWPRSTGIRRINALLDR